MNLRHPFAEAHNNFNSHMSDPTERAKRQRQIGVLSAVTAIAALLFSVDKAPSDSRCTVATVSDGGNATGAVYDALHDLGVNPEFVEGKVYAGQNAMAYIADDNGLVHAGDKFEICIDPSGDKVSSVNPAGTNSQLYPLSTK